MKALRHRVGVGFREANFSFNSLSLPSLFRPSSRVCLAKIYDQIVGQ
jgi:hypothetical protein